MNGELGVNGCKLLLLEWIKNEILLCSTENYVWSLMMECDNVRKKNVYKYVQLGPHAVQWEKKLCWGNNKKKKKKSLKWGTWHAVKLLLESH